jgi:hypothetical protein
MEFLLGVGDPKQEVDVASLEVRGHVVTEDGGVERQRVDLPIRIRPGEGPLVSPEVEKVRVLLEAASAREEADRLREGGDWERAARLLRQAADRIEVKIPRDPEGAAESRTLRALADRMASGEFEARDRKYMMQEVYDRSRSKWEAAQRYRRE